MAVLNVNVTTDYSAQVLNNVTDIVMGNLFGVEAIFASTQFNNVAIKNNVNISGTQLLAHGITVNGGSVDARGWSFSNWDIVTGSFVQLNGSAANNTFYNSEVRDTINGNGGADIIYGGGGLSQGDTLNGGNANDTFRYLLTTGPITDVIDGGVGTADKIKVMDSGTFDFTSATISRVEQLLFGAAGQTISLAGDQIGAGGPIQSVTGTLLANALTVTGTSVDLSTVTFNTWTELSDSITITGTLGDDVLTGSGLADTFVATGGADTLTGGQGNDSVSYQSVNVGSTISGTIDGGDGTADVIAVEHAGPTDFRQAAIVGIEIIDISAGSFVHFDVNQVGATQINTVRGSSGLNQLSVTTSSSTHDIDLSGLIFSNFSTDEDIVFISGDLADNTLTGTDFDDIFNDGLGGADAIYGGNGDDEFIAYVSMAGSSFDGGDGTDTLSVNSIFVANDVRDFRALALNDVERLLVYDSDAIVTLSSAQIGGTAFMQEIDAWFAGSFSLVVTGADTDLSTVTVLNWREGETTLTIEGTTGDDILTGSMVGDIFLASDGHDTLSGGAGDDTIDGGNGNDVITGGSGADELIGGLNTDAVSYAGSSAAVTVDLALNTVSGGDADGDSISGFERAVGSDHNDTFIGSTAANRFIGGLGQDTLTGGDGADIFRYETTSDSLNLLGDLITDFVQASDRIDLGFIDADGAAGANNAFVLTANGGTAGFTGLGQLRYFVGAQNTTISLNISGDNTPDMQIVLTGLYTLTAADFIL